MDILYLCDRKACENCSPECKHTKDIYHAINFEKCEGGGYWEKDNRNRKVSWNRLKQQIEEGLVVVDGSITEIKFKHDSDGQLLVCQAELVEEVKNE